MRIGVRAHDFGKLPADDLARRIAAKGLTCVQLAVSKAIEGLDLKPGDMNPGLAWHVGQAFQRHGVQIAVLGCYINPIHPDPQKRAELLGVFKEHIRFARDFGCSIVGLETGSVNADGSPHPNNHGELAFHQMITSIATLVEEAEKFGVIVCIEGVTSHTVSTPAKMRQVLDTIKSNNLQVIFDPVNLLSKVEGSTLRQIRTGQGDLNYKLLLGWIKARKPEISILLEEASESTAEGCIRFISGVAV